MTELPPAGEEPTREPVPEPTPETPHEPPHESPLLEEPVGVASAADLPDPLDVDPDADPGLS